RARRGGRVRTAAHAAAARAALPHMGLSIRPAGVFGGGAVSAGELSRARNHEFCGGYRDHSVGCAGLSDLAVVGPAGSAARDLSAVKQKSAVSRALPDVLAVPPSDVTS